MLRRKVITIGIVAFWLIMMGLLAREEFVRQSQLPFSTAGSIEVRDTWMGIYTTAEDGTESRIGHLRTQSIPKKEDGDVGIEYRLTMNLAAQVLSFPADISLDGSTWVSRENGLQRVTFTVDSFDEHVMQAEGYVEDGEFHVSIETAGESFPMTIPLNNNLMVSGGLGTTALHIPSLEIGDEVRVPTFDPLTFSYSQYSTIKCVGSDSYTFGEETYPVKILETTANGIKSVSWVTMDNEVVKIQTPFGFHLKKIQPHEALDPTDPSESSDLLNAVAVHPTGIQPFRGAKRMEIQLSGISGEAVPPDNAIQRMTDDLRYTIMSGSLERTELSGDIDYLSGDPFVQVEHPAIQALRDDILQTIMNPGQQANAIYDWLWLNIDKKPILSFPSALDVANTREGDCNEHTVLFTALARAAGIPTRMAIGVVWSDELDGFYYHAWPEVYIEDVWKAMDPTLGQPVADATHIKFLEGNMDAWPKLMSYLGQVEIEVLEIQ